MTSNQKMEMAETRLLNRKEVEAMVRLSRSTIYRMTDRGEFPRNISISDQRVVWRESDIEEWLSGCRLFGDVSEATSDAPWASCDDDEHRDQQHVSSSVAELNHIGELNEKADHIPDAGKKIRMAELYPDYYRDVRHLDEMDVYAVHDTFQVDDPSGCLQHASKKILLSGTRNGGKSLAQDIKEARDTLTRKLQLMGVE